MIRDRLLHAIAIMSGTVAIQGDAGWEYLAIMHLRPYFGHNPFHGFFVQSPWRVLVITPWSLEECHVIAGPRVELLLDFQGYLALEIAHLYHKRLLDVERLLKGHISL